MSALRPRRLGRRGSAAPERRDKIRERLLVHVGNGDIGEIRVGPADDMITVERFYAAGPAGELGVCQEPFWRENSV